MYLSATPISLSHESVTNVVIRMPQTPNSERVRKAAIRTLRSSPSAASPTWNAELITVPRAACWRNVRPWRSIRCSTLRRAAGASSAGGVEVSVVVMIARVAVGDRTTGACRRESVPGAASAPSGDVPNRADLAPHGVPQGRSLDLAIGPRCRAAMLEVRLTLVALAEAVPGLVRRRPVEVTDGGPAARLVELARTERICAPREERHAVHVVPSGMQRCAALAEHHVQRVLVGPLDVRMSGGEVDERARAAVAAHRVQVPQENPAVEGRVRPGQPQLRRPLHVVLLEHVRHGAKPEALEVGL